MSNYIDYLSYPFLSSLSLHYSFTLTALPFILYVCTAINRVNRWRKCGIAVVPLVYPSGDSPCDLTVYGSIAEASIQVYVDGTVLLTYGGIEAGQVYESENNDTE